jgi:hypothetical protein
MDLVLDSMAMAMCRSRHGNSMLPQRREGGNVCGAGMEAADTRRAGGMECCACVMRLLVMLAMMVKGGSMEKLMVMVLALRPMGPLSWAVGRMEIISTAKEQ